MNAMEQFLWAAVSASLGLWLGLVVAYVQGWRRRRRVIRLWQENLAARRQAFQEARKDLKSAAASGDPFRLLSAETLVLALQTQLLVQTHFLEAEGIKELKLVTPSQAT